MRTIPPSELLVNDDGSVYHLHLRPEDLADTVILVGDPGRVAMVAAHFDTRDKEVSNREFHTITGTCKGKRLTVISTGIGTDNIDIVMTELDALANIDFKTRHIHNTLKRLTLLRLGTSGGLQPDLPIGTLVFSRTSIGLDGLLNFYKGRSEVCNHDMERLSCRKRAGTTGWQRPMRSMPTGNFSTCSETTRRRESPYPPPASTLRRGAGYDSNRPTPTCSTE